MRPVEQLQALALCAAAALLLVGVLALLDRRAGRTRPPTVAVVVTLCLAALAVWHQTHGFHYLRTVDFHYHEHFHYVLNSKYFSELGYQHLYGAAVVAAEESGHPLPVETIREMDKYRPLAIERVRQDHARYRALFSPSRWQEFKGDVAMFRRWIEKRPRVLGWQQLLMDQGFSGTPAWTSVAGQISGRFPASPRTLWFFAHLDIALLVLAFALIARSFGRWAFALALLFWGSGYLTYYWITAGAFLRYDWFAALLAGTCALATRRNGLAGAMIGYSAAMRLFPGLLGVMVGLQAVIEWRQKRRGDGVRFLAGFALMLALMVGVSTVQYGPDSWFAFKEKILTHTDRYQVRSIGLPYLFGYSGEEATKAELRTLGIDRWKEKHYALLIERRLWIRIGQLLFVAAAVTVLMRRQLDLLGATVLGCALLPILAAPTTYYYGFMVVPLLAFCRAWPQPYAVIGILWLFAEALLGYVLDLQQTTRFLRQFYLSVSVVCFCAYTIAAMGWAYPKVPPKNNLFVPRTRAES